MAGFSPATSNSERCDERQIVELIAECRDLLAILEVGRAPNAKASERTLPTAADLLARARRGTRDGYPSSTLGGGSPGSVLDDEGVPMPPLSDRTGELAVADEVADPVRVNAATVVRCVGGAVGNLRTAVTAIRSSVPPTPPDDELWCLNHMRHKMFEPRGLGGRDKRCEFCYRFRLLHQMDPPLEVLEHKHRFGRVPSRLVDEILGSRKT